LPCCIVTDNNGSEMFHKLGEEIANRFEFIFYFRGTFFLTMELPLVQEEELEVLKAIFGVDERFCVKDLVLGRIPLQGKVPARCKYCCSKKRRCRKRIGDRVQFFVSSLLYNYK
jgi:hypothetical protein